MVNFTIRSPPLAGISKYQHWLTLTITLQTKDDYCYFPNVEIDTQRQHLWDDVAEKLQNQDFSCCLSVPQIGAISAATYVASLFMMTMENNSKNNI